MSRNLFVLAVIATFLAAPASGLAEGAYNQPIERGAFRHHHVLPHGRVSFRRAMPFFSKQAASAQHRLYEREGLTRDPNDCVIYGCIGNN